MEEPILLVAALVGTFHGLVFVLALLGVGLLLWLAWKAVTGFRKGQ